MKNRRNGKMIWVSKSPMFNVNANGMPVFAGFTKGKTYIKAIHGPIGTQKD